LATRQRKSSQSTNPSIIPNESKLMHKKSKFHLPRKVIRVYTDYAKRLWKETNPEARRFVDSHRVAKSILLVQQLLAQTTLRNQTDVQNLVSAATSSHAATRTVPEPQRQQLLDACEAALQAIGVATITTTTTSTADAAIQYETKLQEHDPLLRNGEQPPRTNGGNTMTLSSAPSTKGLATQHGVNGVAVKSKTSPSKPRRSIGFGAAMGLAVTGWVFSGSYIFTGLFTFMTALGQLEYYRMVMNTGIFPARRISVIGACSMFLAALFTPDLHQIVLPISGLWAMVWFLTMRRTLTPIPEIATTFTGLFYLGYVPSFWVRIRLIGMGREPTRLAPITGPMLKFLEAKGQTLPSFIPQAIHLPITTGAIFIFWTWLCLAFSDVGAYFVGRSFGKTKLGSVFPAAGATSPNKTIEGVVGGCAVSALLAIVGAWVQRWPYPLVTGALHGLFLGLLGLLGDLTASMLKRDAGLKDFGDLLPEHGGIMDRVDSFIWTAPYSYVFVAYFWRWCNFFLTTSFS
jgi:phosphatidate cytidylyltransferase